MDCATASKAVEDAEFDRWDAEQRRLRKRRKVCQRWTRKRVKHLRETLIATLGGVCAGLDPEKWCGSTEDLQIDHVQGRTWDIKKVNQRTRWRRYWREFYEGIPLRVLCKSCNSAHHPGKLPEDFVPVPVLDDGEVPF